MSDLLVWSFKQSIRDPGLGRSVSSHSCKARQRKREGQEGGIGDGPEMFLRGNH